MGEKPILFNTQMVRAILNGSKTQTRRLIKRRYDNTVLEMKTDKYGTRLIEIQKDEEGVTFGKHEDGTTWRKLRAYIEPKPAYKAGDILYVRETWKQATGGTAGPGLFDTILYKADEPQDTTGLMIEERWHPSIHMPKGAARIWLRVTDVRLQRLQDISSEDVDAEGCKEWAYSAATGELLPSAPTWFKILWDETVSEKDKKEYGWDANPWVWAYTFERIDNPREAKA